MTARDTATLMRDLDVAHSILASLEYLLENNHNVRDLHYLSVLAGEGKRKLDAVVDLVSDRL